jgi:hypothetical protein
VILPYFKLFTIIYRVNVFSVYHLLTVYRSCDLIAWLLIGHNMLITEIV